MWLKAVTLPEDDSGVETVEPEVYQGNPECHLDPTSKAVGFIRIHYKSRPNMNTYRNWRVQTYQRVKA